MKEGYIWDDKSIDQLRCRYNLAVQRHEESLTFDGERMLTTDADLLLEWLHIKLGK
jgi:hypothetical protein